MAYRISDRLIDQRLVERSGNASLVGLVKVMQSIGDILRPLMAPIPKTVQLTKPNPKYDEGDDLVLALGRVIPLLADSMSQLAADAAKLASDDPNKALSFLADDVSSLHRLSSGTLQTGGLMASFRSDLSKRMSGIKPLVVKGAGLAQKIAGASALAPVANEGRDFFPGYSATLIAWFRLLSAVVDDFRVGADDAGIVQAMRRFNNSLAGMKW